MGCRDVVQQSDPAVATEQSRAQQVLTTVLVGFVQGEEDVEVHAPSSERITPDLPLIGADVGRIPLVEPHGAARLLRQRQIS